jgi:cold shock CspA family protein
VVRVKKDMRPVPCEMTRRSLPGFPKDDLEEGSATKMDQEKVGVVVCFWPERGYGFLLDIVSGEELFFHVTDLDGRPAPPKKARVSFTVSTFKGRKKASNVRVRPSSIEVLSGAI